MGQDIINWVFTGFGAAMGWILKVIWDALRDLRADIHAIEKDLPEVYARKDDFRSAMVEIKSEIRDMRRDVTAGFQHVDATFGALLKQLGSGGNGG